MPPEQVAKTVVDRARKEAPASSTTETVNTASSTKGVITYEYNGQTYEVPEGTDEKVVFKAILQDQQGVQQSAQPSVQPSAQPPSTQGEVASPQVKPEATTSPDGQSPDGKLDPSTLYQNKEWLTAARQLWEERHPGEPPPADEDLSNRALWTMSSLDNSLMWGGLEANHLRNASAREKEAMLHLMETYEHVGYSWGGAGRAAVSMAGDPLTYVGLASFGFGTAAGTAAKITSREAVKAMLKTGLRTAVEGAAFGAAQDSIKQSAEITVGKEKEFSTGRMALSAAGGAVIGGVVGGGTEAGATALRGLAGKEAPWKRLASTASEGTTKQREAPELIADSVKPQEAAPPSQATTLAEAPENAAGESPSPPGERPEPMGAPVNDVVLDEIIVAPKAAPEVRPEAAKGEALSEVAADIADVGPVPANVQHPRLRQIMETITQAAEDSGARIFPKGREAVTAASSKATAVLTGITPEEMTEVVEALRREATSPEERLLLSNTFKNATDRLEAKASGLYQEFATETDEVVKGQLAIELQRLKSVRDTIKAGDTALSSADGRTLGDRVGAFNTGDRRDLSEASILTEAGLKPSTATNEQRAWAEAEYFRRYERWMAKVESIEAVKAFDQGITEAYARNDVAKALALASDKRSMQEALRKKEMQDLGLIPKATAMGNSVIRGATEYVISTVFTTSTLAVNVIPSVVKTIYRPALDFAMRGPTDYAAYRQMTATYMAMAQSSKTALRAAKASFDYEQSLLSTEPNRLLERDTFFRGRAGRLLRTFPRALGASDEFFSQINYRGYVIGQAVSDAVEEGIAKGLTGEALESFVAKRAEEAQMHLFAKNVDSPQVIEALRQTALDKGLRGEAVSIYVKTQLDKNEDLFHRAMDQAGKNYADDLLFKRRFSEENWPSRMAGGYERFVNNNPIMKLVGQLFFRTPVRVFEEGVRMTPFLNLLAPKMLADLRGANGTAAQVKAEGQMFLSYAIGAWAMSQYAQGKLTSGGPTDYKRRRGRENAGDWQPYSLRTDDGGMISFRNLDPFGTPLKIIANVMDRITELQYRKAQGEFVDHEEKLAMAWLSVGVGSIASAISDANLAQGAAQLYKLAHASVDPEKEDMTFVRFLTQKVQLAVPNQYTKVMQQLDPTIPDPATVMQGLLARINPGSHSISRQYDALGNPRSVANPLGALVGFQTATSDQLKRDRSDKELAVLKEISNLEIATNKGFGVWPVKAPEDYGVIAGEDLRTIYTKDGKQTYYDRLNDIYREYKVAEQLYPILVENKVGSVGNRDVTGTRVELAEKVISNYRKIAYLRLLTEETGIQEGRLKELLRKNEIKAGKHDVTGVPYQ